MEGRTGSTEHERGTQEGERITERVGNARELVLRRSKRGREMVSGDAENVECGEAYVRDNREQTRSCKRRQTGSSQPVATSTLCLGQIYG